MSFGRRTIRSTNISTSATANVHGGRIRWDESGFPRWDTRRASLAGARALLQRMNEKTIDGPHNTRLVHRRRPLSLRDSLKAWAEFWSSGRLLRTEFVERSKGLSRRKNGRRCRRGPRGYEPVPSYATGPILVGTDLGDFSCGVPRRVCVRAMHWQLLSCQTGYGTTTRIATTTG
jgi:hypothetical protein